MKMFVLIIIFLIGKVFAHPSLVFDYTEIINLKNQPHKRPIIALTFDDGPSKPNTLKILKILKEEKVPATFFILGERVKLYSDIIKNTIQQGHEIGNHSYDHKQLTKLSKKDFLYQIKKTNNLLESLKINPLWFRPPYGSTNKFIQEEALKEGMATMLWSIDPKDWKSPPLQHLCSSVLKKAHHGAVVLLHEHSNSTVKALKCIIKGLKEKNFSFVTISNWYKKLQKNINKPSHYIKKNLKKRNSD